MGDVPVHIEVEVHPLGIVVDDEWNFVPAEWDENIEKCRFTKVASNHWTLTLKPTIREFFGSGETPVVKLAMVIRSDDGTKQTRPDQFCSVTDTKYEVVPFEPDPVVKEAKPSGAEYGINYNSDNSVTFVFYDKDTAGKSHKYCYIVGDWNGWERVSEGAMKRDDASGCWWITLNGFDADKEYRFQYRLGNEKGSDTYVSDPFTEIVYDQWNDQYIDGVPAFPEGAKALVSAFRINKPSYTWKYPDFRIEDKNDLVIYEMLFRDFTTSKDIDGAMAELDYIEQLGVNAIELMPIQEFDGNLSWGYNPNHYFALDKAYGTREEYKEFIDECHKRGIAVILDMVFNHATGLNPMNKLYPYGTDLSSNPWFNTTAPHSDNVYEDWNHDFVPTKTMFTRSLAYWLTEYKVDGFRMDLSHGLCGTKKHTSVGNIKHYYEHGVKAISPDAYMILEHWGDNMGSERPALIKEGMMCWDNTTNAYYQTAMGWLKDGDDLSSANKDNYVTYCESHDEERAFFKAKQWGNGTLQTSEEARAARVPLNMAFLTLLNGPKMFYHFAELGFDYSKYQNAQGKWGKNDYGIASQLGTDYDCKMQAKYRPEAWMKAPHCRHAAFKKVGQTIQLRTRLMPEVFEANPTANNTTNNINAESFQWKKCRFIHSN